MHFSRLMLQNFKRFEAAQFDLSSNITLFLGPNSSGKSSILKAMLGLKQTVSSTNEYEVLSGHGDYVDLGVYKDYVYAHDVGKPITVEFDISPSGNEADESLFSPGFDEELKRETISLQYDYDPISDLPRIAKMELTFHFPEEGSAHLTLERKKTRKSYWLRADERFVRAATQYLGERGQPRRERLAKIVRDGISLTHVEKFRFSVPKSFRRHFIDALPLHILDSTLDHLTYVLDRRLFYLGPLRNSPSRSYIRTSHSLAVGPKGEHTPSILSDLDKRRKKATGGQKSQYRANYEALSRWIETLFPGKQVASKTFAELVKVATYDSHAEPVPTRLDEMDSISDVGFGFSQVFPIVVQAAVMPSGGTLVIEQPELHLHPMAQARLAMVVADASKMGRRFIIETHSEHFIRGLQIEVSNRRVRRKSGLSCKDIRIYYVPDPPGDPIEMALNEYGEFVDEWPSGFFDKAYQLAFQLLLNKAKGR